MKVLARRNEFFGQSPALLEENQRTAWMAQLGVSSAAEVVNVDKVSAKGKEVRLPVSLPEKEGVGYKASAMFVPEGTSEGIPLEVRLEKQGAEKFLVFEMAQQGRYLVAVVAYDIASGKNFEETEQVFVLAHKGQKSAPALNSTPVEPLPKIPNAKFTQSPVWKGDQPNSHSSKGDVENKELPGVTGKELKGHNINVKGMEEFEAGHRPGDAHETRSENHDSFDQAVGYYLSTLTARKFDQLIGEGEFPKLVASKTGKKEIEFQVNENGDTNAYYLPSDERVATGTSGGRWDLGADGDVVVHEFGHMILDHLAHDLNYGDDSGAMHEGFGDAQASFVFADPELSEDFQKVYPPAKGGKGLRNAFNPFKISDKSNEVHDRGEVFAGFSWAVGEYLHTALTGKPRNPDRDVEPLNRTACDESLKLLWNYPLFLGTKSPTRLDFVRSYKQAVDSLKAAGKLDSRIDVDALKKFMDEEAKRRELDQLEVKPPFSGQAVEITGFKSPMDAFPHIVKNLGLDPANVRLGARNASPMVGPNGEQITRYVLRQRINIGNRDAFLPIEDDYLTVTQHKDGRIFVQVGALATVAELSKKVGKEAQAATPLSLSEEAERGTQQSLLATALAKTATLSDEAKKEKKLQERLLGHGLKLQTPPVTPEQKELARQRTFAALAMRKIESLFAAKNDDNISVDELIRIARDLVKGGNTPTSSIVDKGTSAADKQKALAELIKASLVWQGGMLKAKVVVGPLVYYAPVEADGHLGLPTVSVRAICGPDVFAVKSHKH